MGIPLVHLVVIYGVQIPSESLIGYQTIVFVFMFYFILYGLMQFVSDILYYCLFGHNYVVLVPVDLWGQFSAHYGQLC